MKRITIVVSCFLALFYGIKVSGQTASTVEANASAMIVSPLQLINSSDLAFGNIFQVQGKSTVTIDPVADPVPHFSNPTANTNDPDVTSSMFTVNGIPNAIFVIGLPKKDIQITAGSAKMKVSTFKSSFNNDLGTINSSGTQTFYVGGTLEVGNNQKLGDYSGEFQVTIHYQ